MSKNTKKLAPKLRFPEFRDSGEWDYPSLSMTCDRITEKVGDKKLITVSITAGTGFVSQAEKFSRDISGNQYKNYIVLNKGEYSFNKGNSKRFPQGCIYKLKEFDQVAAPNAFISFKFKKDYVGDFFQGYFECNRHGEQLKKFISSGARSDGLLNINANDFFTIKFPTPRQKEQQKIADCLCSIDDLISTQSQKVEALKTHKKGLMQQLFPREGETVPRLRFPEFRDAGAWKKMNITEIAKTSIGLVTTMTTSYSDSGVPLIRNSDIQQLKVRKEKLIFLQESFADKYPRKKLKKGDIVTVHTGDIGVSAIIDDDLEGCLGFATLNTRILKNDVLPEYICWYFNSENYIRFALSMATGDGRNNFNLSDFDRSVVPIPSMIEQKKIVTCLTSIDDLITAQNLKLEALKTHKKGLMQQLFPSTEANSE